MRTDGQVRAGIGFATGRKNFIKVLRTYIDCWQECGLVEEDRAQLNLFVAYDLKYNNTKVSDYTNISIRLRSMVDNINFLDAEYKRDEISGLCGRGVISEKEAKLLFGPGYAGQRNIVLYSAIKNGMDCLLFLDDDEYPLAVTKTRRTAVWGGQHVLATHLEHIQSADITNGHHCGYISPIPFIEFNDELTENDFRIFIETISNDIVNWEKIHSLMMQGGVTYADTRVLMSDEAQDVPEEKKCKFISGANLCVNLKDPMRVYPFYNPPGARGEDTFLSTCLSERTVKRVPCYTFHDGFGTYKHLLNGVLPVALKPVTADRAENVERFYNACIGWIRYKPLLMYITRPNEFEKNIAEMKKQLEFTLPKLCAYFGRGDFRKIASELDYYSRNAAKHYEQFLCVRGIWDRVIASLEQR